jgi:hypothetical protein
VIHLICLHLVELHAELLNIYFAGVAVDVDYSTEAVRSALQKTEERLDEFKFMPFTAFDFDIIFN